MDKLVTTPYDFIWRVKNPEEYYMRMNESKPKYIVHINGKELGGFYGVFRSFDDDYYYVEYYDVNNKSESIRLHKDVEMILVVIK